MENMQITEEEVKQLETVYQNLESRLISKVGAAAGIKAVVDSIRARQKQKGLD